MALVWFEDIGLIWMTWIWFEWHWLVWDRWMRPFIQSWWLRQGSHVSPVCMCVCIYACIHACIYRVCIYACVHAHAVYVYLPSKVLCHYLCVYIHTYIRTCPYRCTNTNGSFMCSCNAGYYTVEERQAASNCSLLIYEPGTAGVHVHFENKGLGTFCLDIGIYANIHTSIRANKHNTLIFSWMRTLAPKRSNFFRTPEHAQGAPTYCYTYCIDTCKFSLHLHVPFCNICSQVASFSPPTLSPQWPAVP